MTRLLPSPVSTPFTFWYLVVLLATTALQHLLGETVSARLLELASTDAHNLWRRWLDIGVSYGFFATAGALVPVLARRFRMWAVPAIEAGIVVIYLIDGPGTLGGIVTFAGHLIALHIGMLGWWRWLGRRGVTGTLPAPAGPGDRARPLAGSAAR
ncbi:hypothetical protein [Amycolatopsis sp. ATCC 39116]|uniref:hypothetical protein n=1 Tax=Amycolatopsis sp. (strain ATCC 39116 / 75iv2) TaxID=385957 RepID=UPI001F2A2FAC|nr:hypothetical protein [Amycolatopsis sp. ATCC 39116]